MSSPAQVLILLLGCITPIQALVPHTAQWGSALPRASAQREHSVLRAGLSSSDDELLSRRQTLIALSTVSVSAAASSAQPRVARAEDASMYAPKFVQQYDDFVTSPEGFSYRDVTVGKGEAAKPGDRVVFDWSGYTIGYFGRPFQAKGGPQGGAFDKEIDYARTVIGSGTMVKGLEGGLVGLQPGGVRQIVVPFGPLSYPAGDMAHDKVGPKPSTFSGDRALNFVLENPRVDRTLLFNVKVIRIDSPNGKGGFNRG
jgi:FKBP-type peptidyl-prolyl cis-trans isomerase